MTRYVLDTDTLSDLVRRHPNPALIQRLASQPAGSLYATVISVFELRTGCSRRDDHGEKLWASIEEKLLSHFQILPFEPRHAVRAGDLLADLLARGRPIGLEDTLISAIALTEGARVVTGNTRHYVRVPGLIVENWLLPTNAQEP